ncbi:GAF domain-containing protein [Sphingomonas trueperi]|uniref:GAF domain-containing protein n=2 Tax=Sphingomonadaceae TaxID=41297 RepID=A0A7X6BCT1_9SPHN|nr:GAF domain-containing protein [Sphingomonas trueperi]
MDSGFRRNDGRGASPLAPSAAISYIAAMYSFDITADTKAELYRDLAAALDSLTADEPDAIANMANVSALIGQYLPDLNWAGFYRNVKDELVLGPFQGKAACIRIPFGKGVCGAAAATRETQLVEDVHAFPGHIACDAASRSELVVPIVHQGELLGVLDLDSPLRARFDAGDAAGCEALMRILAPRIA